MAQILIGSPENKSAKLEAWEDDMKNLETKELKNYVELGAKKELKNHMELQMMDAV